MADGREVVEDYSHTGLSLRRHPVDFQRKSARRAKDGNSRELARAPASRLSQGGDVITYHHAVIRAIRVSKRA